MEHPNNRNDESDTGILKGDRMATSPSILQIGLLNMTFTLTGCELSTGIFQESQPIENQLEVTLAADPTYVPQTLAASTREPILEISDEQQTPALGSSEQLNPSPTKSLLPQTQSATESAIPEPAANNQSDRHFFGEFNGVKTKWEAMKQTLAGELEEQNRKVQALKLKLQLIEQIAQNVDFKTKAYVVSPYHLFAEFTLENHTPYAIKDISITCDQIAPTGTIITSQTETIYDIIKSQTRSSYIPLPYGIKHRQTQSLQCQITNFTVHNPE